MCGIAVVVSKGDPKIRPEFLQAMTDHVAHRGPDGEGYWHGSGVSFGHRRLRVVDLSEAAAQPMEYHGLSIVYNGEVYNAPELREELVSMGYTFASQSDTEVILAAWHAWGTASQHRFNGMWAFVLYDSRNGTLYGSRDPFGIKPLHYTSTPNWFLVGSEIKQFLACPEFVPTMNQQVAAQYVLHELLNTGTETFFDGVFTLLPGHMFTYAVAIHHFKVEQWAQVSDHSKINLNKVKDSESFLHHFRQSIRLRLRSDVPVGGSFSGGMDSSAISVVVRNILGKGPEYHTVTCCFPETDPDGLACVHEINELHGFTAHLISPDLNEIWENDLFRKITWHQDQPLPGMSHFLEYAVFRKAKQEGLTVMLDGQGADEYLAGYTEFYYAAWTELFLTMRWLSLVREIRNRAGQTGALLPIIRPWVRYIALTTRLYRMRTARFRGIQPAWMRGKNASPTIRREHCSVRKLSLDQLLVVSLPYQLHSQDRNSMMHGVESRLPFLDPELVALCLSLPVQAKVHHGKRKAVLRWALQEYLPGRLLKSTQKHAFEPPEREWILNNQQRFVAYLQKAVKYFPDFFTPELIPAFNDACSRPDANLRVFYRITSLVVWAEAFGVTDKRGH